MVGKGFSERKQKAKIINKKIADKSDFIKIQQVCSR